MVTWLDMRTHPHNSLRTLVATGQNHNKNQLRSSFSIRFKSGCQQLVVLRIFRLVVLRIFRLCTARVSQNPLQIQEPKHPNINLLLPCFNLLYRICGTCAISLPTLHPKLMHITTYSPKYRYRQYLQCCSVTTFFEKMQLQMQCYNNVLWRKKFQIL